VNLPTKTLYGNSGPYLTKVKLLDLGKKLVRVYLHRFHRSDEDRELHSHPWTWSIAIVLRGGYAETRRDLVDQILGLSRTVVRRPGSVFLIRHDTYHRVELLGRESWSLFIAGPERHPWFFMDPATGETTPWRTFIRRKGLRPAGE